MHKVDEAVSLSDLKKLTLIYSNILENYLVKTGLVTSDTYQNHNTGEGHPEKIDRVTAVIDNFKKIDNKD